MHQIDPHGLDETHEQAEQSEGETWIAEDFLVVTQRHKGLEDREVTVLCALLVVVIETREVDWNMLRIKLFIIVVIFRNGGIGWFVFTIADIVSTDFFFFFFSFFLFIGSRPSVLRDFGLVNARVILRNPP